MTVFERVFLTRSDYEKYSVPEGGIIVPPDYFGNGDKYVYFSKYHSSIIKSNNPKIYRMVSTVYRKYDSKIFGRVVHYRRVGGDVPIGFQPSEFGCDDTTNLRKLLDEVFFIKESL